MDNEIDVDELDQKMQKNGWKFKGAIINYKNAFKEQASIYEKDGKYVVSGIDSSGKKELFENISKKEAEKSINDSIKEISKYIFRQID